MARTGVLLVPNSNYHRKWRELACFSTFSMVSTWRRIGNSNRMRNICRNGARSEADLAQCGALALPPPFLFLWLLVQIFFNAPLRKLGLMSPCGPRLRQGWVFSVAPCIWCHSGAASQRTKQPCESEQP